MLQQIRQRIKVKTKGVLEVSEEKRCAPFKD